MDRGGLLDVGASGGVVVLVESHVSEVAQDRRERALVRIRPDRLVDLASSRDVPELVLADRQLDVGVAELARLRSARFVQRLIADSASSFPRA